MAQRRATEVFYGMCGLCEQSCHTDAFQIGGRYYHERCYAAAHLIGGGGREYVTRGGAMRPLPKTATPTIDDAVERLRHFADYLDSAGGEVYAREVATVLREVLAILSDA
jgi:ferredoxin